MHGIKHCGYKSLSDMLADQNNMDGASENTGGTNSQLWFHFLDKLVFHYVNNYSQKTNKTSRFKWCITFTYNLHKNAFLYALISLSKYTSTDYRWKETFILCRYQSQIHNWSSSIGAQSCKRQHWLKVTQAIRSCRLYTQASRLKLNFKEKVMNTFNNINV